MTDTIMYGNKTLKIKRFSGPLYRANTSTSYLSPRKNNVNNEKNVNNGNARPESLNIRASVNYAGAPMKYFTLSKNETRAYTKYDKPFVKTWNPVSDLVLLDILDLKTRRALGEIIGEESLAIAFPIKGNNVSRISTEETMMHDNIVLGAICTLNIADGYYMERLGNNMDFVFHSEVGLCPTAFGKLKLVAAKRNTSAPAGPNKSKRARSRLGYNNNNMAKYRQSRRRRGNNYNSNNNNVNRNGIGNKNENENEFPSILRRGLTMGNLESINNNNRKHNRGPLTMSMLFNNNNNTSMKE
jgi:hypothetical protein